MALKLETLEDLYLDSLKDLYSADYQIIFAFPKMVAAANSPDLKRGFEKHLEQTKRQTERLEQIFTQRQESPRGKKCMGMEGLLNEGKEIILQEAEPKVQDAGLIAAAQKVEHYEISGYGTARTFAETLGYTNDVRLLQQTLDEEAHTNEILTTMAEGHTNAQAE